MKPIRAPSKAPYALYRHFVSFLLIFLILSLIPSILAGQTGKLPNASTETALYHFTGGLDGGTPTAGLVFDQAGNLYGTTRSGGLYGHGAVFKLTPAGDSWTETVLYSFTGGQDGDSPNGALYLDEHGWLWGTAYGGGDFGVGTLFALYPTGGGSTFQLVHSFAGGSDGAHPAAGVMPFGRGQLYGTTTEGGETPGWWYCKNPGCGTIYWWNGIDFFGVWNIFTAKTGIEPHSRLINDADDACFLGTTLWGGRTIGGYGSVFADCQQFIYTVHTFSARGKTGYNPMGGVLRDDFGNIYGTTSKGANHSVGAVFGIFGLRAKALHEFSRYDGASPVGELLFDADGNLYGTTYSGGANDQGAVFKLTPGINGRWTETLLYSFTGSDGANPEGTLIFDGTDNLYGTTSGGGAYGAGVVFKVPNVRVGPQVTLMPTSRRFPRQVIYTTSASKTVTLSNTGDRMLTISNITISPGSNFAVSSNTCRDTLALGAQCKVGVTFTPTALGSFGATLTFSDNAANSPQTVPLNGVAVLPATLMPASATYKKQAVGTASSPRTFTLTNNQAVTLDSIAISTTGDFAVFGTTCTTSLAAKSKCTISVTFTPTQTGTRTGTLSVSDSANNSPQTSSLTGTGT